jgi:hypothetical protein
MVRVALRRTLQMLAGWPHGTEAIMVAHIFTTELLAGPVRDGLAGGRAGDHVRRQAADHSDPAEDHRHRRQALAGT